MNEKTAIIAFFSFQNILYSIDHHWKENVFATCGEKVEIWDEQRSTPMRTFSWGVDSVSSLRFNPIETHLLGATASDRSILLYDMRGSTPLRKVSLVKEVSFPSLLPKRILNY